MFSIRTTYKTLTPSCAARVNGARLPSVRRCASQDLQEHDIPNPPLGRWAKHAAGHKVKRIPLPTAKAGVALTVVIASGEVRQEPDTLASAREQARLKATELDLSAEVLAHPLVQKSFDKLRKAKPGNTSLVSLSSDGYVQLELAPASIDRAERCLLQIVAVAKGQGIELSAKAYATLPNFPTDVLPVWQL